MLRAAEPALGELLDRPLHRIERVLLARQDGEFQQAVKALGQRLSGMLDVQTRAVHGERRDRHPVLRERSGLVDTEHGGGAERLERRHPPHQDVPPGDAPRADREEERQNDGELLGHERHGEGEAGENAVEPAAPEESVERRDGPAQHDSDRRQHAHESADLALEPRVLLAEAGERLADLAELGGRAGGRHLRDALPTDDERSRVHAGRVAAGPHAGRSVTAQLAYRHRFTGEQRLVDGEVHAPQDNAVGRHAIALRDGKDVAADDLATRDAPLAALADHERPRAREVPQRVEGAFRLLVLVEADADDHRDRDEQHRRFAHVAQHHVYGDAPEQEQDHRLTHDVERDVDDPSPVAGRQLVRTVAPQALGRGSFAESREPLDVAVGAQGRAFFATVGPSVKGKPCPFGARNGRR